MVDNDISATAQNIKMGSFGYAYNGQPSDKKQESLSKIFI